MSGYPRENFDVIVVGGGHAGCEAAFAAARTGSRVAMITLDPSRIGVMSCNPAIGGLAKGQLVKEIDALGGIMGINTDRAAIQYRRLNRSKGPAVRSSRAQCDKPLYAKRMQEFIASVPNLEVIPAEVSEIIEKNKKITGVRLGDGSEISCRAVVITSGTFMQAVMHIGEEQEAGGRQGDGVSLGLSSSLARLGFRLRRLKTGTPPRVHKKTINYSDLESQPADSDPVPFSFYSRPQPFPLLPQVHCHITYTNEQAHEIIEKNFSRSPIFNGQITGIGPRYCPSIEDKISRFSDRDRHQIFLEPEGLEVDEVYINGISTSLPRDVQDIFVRNIKGLENAEFIRYGYAVEYDAIDARQLTHELQSKEVEGLFLAGQVNGTSGYEEAGAQGLIAGVNASLLSQGRESFTLSRLDGYIGVMIDDLTTTGVDEPYRMFTSRAEYRLLLREDNADLRLSPRAFEVGLLGEEQKKIYEARVQGIDSLKSEADQAYFYPTPETRDWFTSRGMHAIQDRVSAGELLKRPEFDWSLLGELGFDSSAWDESVREQVAIQIKYAGYIKRDLEVLEGVRKNEGMKIPVQFDYSRIQSLSSEVRGKLEAVRPENLAQAGRISGVTPAAIASLMIHLKMKETQKEESHG